MGENFSILNELQMAEPQVKKRKRNEVTRNNEGKYQCQHCDYEASKPSNLTQHILLFHLFKLLSLGVLGFSLLLAWSEGELLEGSEKHRAFSSGSPLPGAPPPAWSLAQQK